MPGKNVMEKETQVECLACDNNFKTSKMKSEGDVFMCPHCGQEHFASYDEVEEVWFPALK